MIPIPAAFYLATLGLAAAQRDPAGAEEAAFLGLSGAGILASAAALAPRAAYRLAGGAALAGLACLWLLHQGPESGAAVCLVLAIALGLAGSQAVRSSGIGWASEPPGPAGSVRLVRIAVPLALGAQLAARPGLLLPPLLDLRTLVSLLLLPAAAALALGVVAERFGPHRSLALGALAVSVVPGFNVTNTLGLVASAAGAWAGDPRRSRGSRGLGLSMLIASSGTLAVAKDPGLGLAALLGGAAVAGLLGRRRGEPGACSEPTPSQTAPALSTPAPSVPSPVASPTAATSLVAGTIVAWVGLLAEADPQSLVPGLAILAMALPGGRAAAQATARLAVAVAGAGVLAGGYPWLRDDPWTSALRAVGEALGAPFDGSPAATAGLLLLAAGLAIRAAGSAGRSPGVRGSGWGARLAARTPIVVLGFLLVAQMPSGRVLPLPPPERSAAGPHHGVELDGSPVREVVIDSYLVHAAGLPTREPILWILLEDAEGNPLARWRMISGRDTADWAAARADVAARPGFVAPRPFHSRLALDGRFFGRTYRAHFRTEKPVRARRLSLGRSGALAREVEIHLQRLEVRR